ncbi:MAG TPA: hypothetical protein VK107_02250 [Alloiococcus sp.]|nr:hypothetical protein [Alloiococcus sp.]
MEERQMKELTIEIDIETYEEFQAYCDESRFDRNEILEHLMEHFVEESKAMMKKMKDGYAEMAKLNLEITSEFTDCENEVNIHL